MAYTGSVGQVVSPQQTKSSFRRIRPKQGSLRMRFVVYVSLLLCAVVTLVLLLLNLSGSLNPVSAKLEQTLNHQLDSSAAVISEDIDTLASNATVFSQQMSLLLDEALADAGLSFEDLRDNPEALSALQSDAYHTVYSNMRTAPCSGAFYFLNTTVNSSLEQDRYNGVYLKVANLNSENTIHNEASLYRGAASVARENDINLHSTWQNELLAGHFSELDAMMNRFTERLSNSYLLTSIYELPDTWECARFLCVPILDAQGNTVGVCGYEISDLFFKLSHKTVNTEQAYLACALLDKTPDGYVGQVSGSQAGYAPPVDEFFTIEEGNPLSTIRCGEMSFYGKVQDITIGERSHTLAIMLPEVQYNNIIRDGQLKTAAVLLTIMAVTIIACLYLSKQYVSPILKGLAQIKSGNRSDAQSTIPEINELFAFLAQQDRKHNDSLSALAQEKQAVQSENECLQLEYEQARLAYEKMQDEYLKSQEDLTTAKIELDRLTYSRKKEIDPNDYQHFLTGIQMLTKTEREIFDWYLDGKTAKEVLELTGTKESTLKFHNHNILQKLGVSSRKQMLRFAALMKQQEEGGNAE